MKYILSASKKIQGKVLRRIIATRDICKHGVVEGDLGGWVEGEHNLSQEGDCWIDFDGIVTGKTKITGDTLVIATK